MSIRLYSGKLGSGKTYRVVYELAKTDLLKKYYVIHNIPDLKIKSEFIKSFNSEFNDMGFEPSEMFNYEFQEDLSKKILEKYGRGVLWIIDECDKIGFDRTNSSMKKWLSMSRHLGQEIYLISQSKWNIAKDYMNLIEIEIQGKKGYIFSSFIYSWYSGSEKFATDRLPKDKSVYDLYRSFKIAETKTPKSKFLKWFLYLGIFAVVALVYFIFFAMPKSFKNSKIDKNIITSKPVSNDNPSSADNKIISPFDKPIIYSFAGRSKDQYLLADNFGNIYPISHISKDKIYHAFLDDREIVLIDLKKGITTYKPTYIKELKVSPAAAGGRASTSQQAVNEGLYIKELWIDVH